MPASTIMIVEDEGIIAMDIRSQLETFGYHVVAMAFTGAQAITLAERHKPDLIMMDIVLKGTMDGISAARSIWENFKIPVIFLTAYSDPSTLKRARTVGAYGYLVKPFRPDELQASIEVALYKHQLEKRLTESEQWFAKTLHCISDAVIATDAEANVRFMNPVAETVLGTSLKESAGAPIEELMVLLNEAEGTPVENPVPRALRDLSITSQEQPTLLKTARGQPFPIDKSAAPILSDDGDLLGAVMVFRDITSRRRIELRLRESEERFHSAFDYATIGMALVSIAGRFLQINSALIKIFGYSKKEILESSLRQLICAEDYELLEHYLHRLLADDLPSFQIEVQSRAKIPGQILWNLLSASLVRDANGEPQYFILQFQDITDRKYVEQQLNYFANHDPLTGLLNRVQFHSHFSKALASVKRNDSKLALMFLDLDRFKLINDTLGHQIGDLLLQAVGIRLKNSLRTNDVLARLGGDEFIVLLTDVHSVEDVARVAQKTIEILMHPFAVEGHDIIVTTSIGISLYPDDGENSQLLLRNADAAMYLAKDLGKNNFQFYTADMTARSIERLNIERGLRQALTDSELLLYYQPQIDVAHNSAVSVEALLRWRHSDWGLVEPVRFIQIAEETGLIVPLGNWVLKNACRQTKIWQQQGSCFQRVAVNVSPRQFLENDLFETVKTILDDTGLSASSLELEITESAVMQDPDRTLQILQKLHDLGVQLSIDDFGTGYSSLTYLRRFPVHSVKIDRSFVQSICHDESSKTLVRAIIALAHELNLKVIAEGVETERQFLFLKEQGCDFLQGYIYYRPLPPEQLTDFTSSGRL